LDGGARLFLLGIVPRLFSPPLPLTHGTAEILNESLLMKATFRAHLPAAFLTGGGRDEGGAGGGEEATKRKIGAFPQPFSALHHQRAAPRLSRSFSFFFNLLNSQAQAVTANYCEK